MEFSKEFLSDLMMVFKRNNDEALGSDVITDSTVNESGFKDGLLTRIKNFFTGE